jgi:preprotein translocase subunit YajC
MNPETVANLIPIVLGTGSFAASVLVVYFLLQFRTRTRQFRHQERVAALEKGIELPPEPPPGPNAYLLRGLIWLSVGIGLSIFFLALFAAEKDRDLLGPSTFGIIPIGVGISYLIVYRIEARQQKAARHA